MPPRTESAFARWFKSALLLGGMDILVVDDDPDIRSTVADILSQEGLAARAVGSAAAAIEVLRAHEGPCVVLLDLSMPGGGGDMVINVIDGLDNSVGRLSVIVMSASTELRAVRGRSPVVDQLFKPFDLDELVSKVRRAVTQAFGDSRS